MELDRDTETETVPLSPEERRLLEEQGYIGIGADDEEGDK